MDDAEALLVSMKGLGAWCERDGELPPSGLGCPSRREVKEDRAVGLVERISEEESFLELEVKDKEEGLPQSGCFIHRS